MTSAVTHAALVESAAADQPESSAPIAAGDAAVARLTARLRSGEEAAWREFHHQYFDRLMRYLLVMCRGDEEASREAMQAALVKIVRHVRRFDREEAWWCWLTVVVRSCVIDDARRRSSYRAFLARYSEGFRHSGKPDADEPWPELLDECLAALPADERTLLIAKYRDGESTAGLAADAGCTPKAMESRLARLRQRVRAALLDHFRHEN